MQVNQKVASEDQYGRFLEQLRRNLEEQLRAQQRQQANENAQRATDEMRQRLRQGGSAMRMTPASGTGLPDPRREAAVIGPREQSMLSGFVGTQRFATDLSRMAQDLSTRFSPSSVTAAIRDFERNPASSMLDTGVSVAVSLATGPVGGLFNLVSRAVEFVTGVELPTFDDLGKAMRGFASGLFAALDRAISGFFARVGTSMGLTEPEDYCSEELEMCFGSSYDLDAAEQAAEEDALSGTSEERFDPDSFGAEDTCEDSSQSCNSNETCSEADTGGYDF